MTCASCGSERTAEVNAKCSDLCYVRLDGRERDGYVPNDLGIGGGDYIEFRFCLDCGRIRGEWPRPKTGIEKGDDEE